MSLFSRCVHAVQKPPPPCPTSHFCSWWTRPTKHLPICVRHDVKLVDPLLEGIYCHHRGQGLSWLRGKHLTWGMLKLSPMFNTDQGVRKSMIPKRVRGAIAVRAAVCSGGTGSTVSKPSQFNPSGWQLRSGDTNLRWHTTHYTQLHTTHYTLLVTHYTQYGCLGGCPLCRHLQVASARIWQALSWVRT